MQRNLRIGYVSEGGTGIDVWSGIPARVLNSLRKMNVHVEVYGPLSQKQKYLLTPVKVLARMRGSSVSLGHYPLMLKSYARQIATAIRERPVDVIVATSSIQVAALQCAQPIIFWTDAVFHGMYEYYNGAFFNMPPAAIERAKRAEEAALGKCTFAVYASEWAARSARQLTDPRKIHVLPFGAGFDIQHTRSDVERWAKQRRQQRPRACELLFIGVDWQRKGGAIAVEAAKILNEVGIPTTLTVVGCHPPVPLPDYVHVLGFISKTTPGGEEKLKVLLRKADFFIMPTTAEAAGIVFCEASAFGLPSLSYATGGVPDYVRSGVNGVCLPPGTAGTEFASIIQQIVEDDDRYKSLCLGAFDEFVTRLNWDSSVRVLLELCSSAMEQVSQRQGAVGNTIHA